MRLSIILYSLLVRLSTFFKNILDKNNLIAYNSITQNDCAQSNDTQLDKKEIGGKEMSIYDYKVTDKDGSEVSMREYEGKVLLIVNTATGCGFTPQFDGLQDLYEKYQGKGFEILDFPCNQFGNQAPGSDEEITDFCNSRYGITFKQFAKIDVNGANEIPLYKYLKKQQSGMLGSMIKWNFTKFLVDREGNVVERFAPTKEPKAIEDKIEELL